jgi:hypothetical protein
MRVHVQKQTGHTGTYYRTHYYCILSCTTASVHSRQTAAYYYALGLLPRTFCPARLEHGLRLTAPPGCDGQNARQMCLSLPQYVTVPQRRCVCHSAVKGAASGKTRQKWARPGQRCSRKCLAFCLVSSSSTGALTSVCALCAVVWHLRLFLQSSAESARHTAAGSAV